MPDIGGELLNNVGNNVLSCMRAVTSSHGRPYKTREDRMINIVFRVSDQFHDQIYDFLT